VTRRLLGLLRGQSTLMSISVLSRVLHQAMGVAIPVAAGLFVVRAAQGDAPSVGGVIMVLGALALIKGLFRYLEQFTGHAVAFRLLAELRGSVFRWLERVEPGRTETLRGGDLVARVSGDIGRVEPFYAHSIAPVLAAVLLPISVLAGLAVVAGALPALVLAGFVVVYLLVVPWIGWRRVGAQGAEERRLAGETAARVTDIVQGAEEIALLGAGGEVLDEAASSDEVLGSVRRSLARSAANRSLLGGLVSAAALLTVSIVGVTRDVGIDVLVASIIVSWTLMASLRSLEEIIPDTEQSLAAAARLFELEDLAPQTSGDVARPIDGSVRFERVAVQGDGQVMVDSVDLTIPDGSFLGIVGPSGSGKSSLVETLVRHRDPSYGSVFLGGLSVADLSLSALRAAVALVPQRLDVFHGTVASNLQVARPSAGRAEMRLVLERASLLDWVESLEGGLEAPLGEGGRGLSGGQAQLLALARAFLRDPRVLILDEATSELDVDTERAVLDEVYSERGRRTLVVVAHRMDTVVMADQIAVMDGGRLVELGPHGDLMAANGLYAELWARHADMLADS
jgi:ATP-binding cassette, subfamily C, bacterial CydC